MNDVSRGGEMASDDEALRAKRRRQEIGIILGTRLALVLLGVLFVFLGFRTAQPTNWIFFAVASLLWIGWIVVSFSTRRRLLGGQADVARATDTPTDPLGRDAMIDDETHGQEQPRPGVTVTGLVIGIQLLFLVFGAVFAIVAAITSEPLKWVLFASAGMMVVFCIIVNVSNRRRLRRK